MENVGGMGTMSDNTAAAVQQILELLAVMETCHVCGATLILDGDPPHCEDCSGDCGMHDDPACKPMAALHTNAGRALVALESALADRNQRIAELEAADRKSRESGCWCDEHGHPCQGCGWRQRIAELEAALRQVDDVLAVNWIAVPDGDYTFALGHLILRAIEEHDDPAVSEIAAARQSEMDAAIRRERAAEEGRNLVVAELQRIQLELGIRCVGGEPTRNFRVPEERDGEPTCPKCRKPITTTDHHGILWVCCHCGWRGELQNADSRALQPRQRVADAGDTRECGEVCGSAQEPRPLDQGLVDRIHGLVGHMEVDPDEDLGEGLCPVCGHLLEKVRPGKWQCSWCE